MKKFFTSRTNWTVAVMFVIGGTEAIAQFIPDGIESLLLGGLAVLAMAFKMNPSQYYPIKD